MTRTHLVPTGERCRQAATETVRATFDRAGTPLDGQSLDFRLAAVAAEAAQLYIRAIEDDAGVPLPLVTDLLTVVAALRAVLGMSATPVNAEIFYWGRPGG